MLTNFQISLETPVNFKLSIRCIINYEQLKTNMGLDAADKDYN